VEVDGVLVAADPAPRRQLELPLALLVEERVELDGLDLAGDADLLELVLDDARVLARRGAGGVDLEHDGRTEARRPDACDAASAGGHEQCGGGERDDEDGSGLSAAH
jgi:hypothetical protein